MKLYNSLSRKVEEFEPLDGKSVRMYSCGPTVYDHVHIGNLSAFIYADTLRRVLIANNYDVNHAMNFTDVDDKTIRRSAERYPDTAPEIALKQLTQEYSQVFLSDMEAMGNDIDALTLVKATDSIEAMRGLIAQLYKNGFAYIADDGVYFSIQKYKSSGKQYGQLLKIDSSNTSSARINNDEYDKESVHDFALWKLQKGNEPAWDFELDGHNLLGRPGWHIECSVMSSGALGQPFDIHTGGVDLLFPHHENEIAQSTAGQDTPIYSQFFFHNEHMLVDGKKMSKSLGNFFTLRDIQEKGYDPLAFRLMVLQSHYRSQSNFTWENLEAAQNRLNDWRAWADRRYQTTIDKMPTALDDMWHDTFSNMRSELSNDMNTPQALASLSKLVNWMEQHPIPSQDSKHTVGALKLIDDVFGLELDNRSDISTAQKDIITEREVARKNKSWTKSDELRDLLNKQGIGIKDTDHGQIWYRL